MSKIGTSTPYGLSYFENIFKCVRRNFKKSKTIKILCYVTEEREYPLYKNIGKGTVFFSTKY